MKTITLSPKVSFTAQEYAGQGNAILGIRDSGKSYSATFFAERLLDAGIPFVAFDPVGVWRFLKTPGTGAGYPVVVAAPEGGDLPLNVASAPEIVRAAMRDNVPLVVDLYAMGLSKADWRRIVADCVSVLLYENKTCGLRHVFLEEAAEFCPQRVGPEQGVVYSVIEKLARMGGNASLGYTLINQRAEEVNKAVLENCDCLFLHRQKGKNSLMSLQKWIDFSVGGKTKEIVAALPGLPQGQCFAWLPGADSPELVKMPHKRTFHPDRRKPELTAKAVSGKVDVSSFVGQLQKTLPKLAEEAAANDPKALKSRISALERELKKKAPVGASPEELRGAQEAGFDECRRRTREMNESILKKLQALSEFVAAPLDENPNNPLMTLGRMSPRPLAKLPPMAEEHLPLKHIAPAAKQNGLSVKLPEGERAILTVCAQNGAEGATREELTVLTGYKRSTRDAYIQRLRAQTGDGESIHPPYVDIQGDRIIATADGISALGANFEMLPRGADLRDYWLNRLPSGEKAILNMAFHAFPKALARDAIEAYTGFKRSTRDAYIQRLSTRRLVIVIGRGEVKANEHLF